MTDDEKDELLLSLAIEAEMMRSIVGILCVKSLPDEVLDKIIEELDTPIAQFGPGKNIVADAHLMHAVQDRIADKIAFLRSQKRRRGY